MLGDLFKNNLLHDVANSIYIKSNKSWFVLEGI